MAPEPMTPDGPEPPRPRVFLSYARADRARVQKIVAGLEAAGLDVWWDRAIETGARFSTDIERELQAADAVVVAWSAAASASTWVQDEAGVGRDRGRLVPVLLDGTLPPLGFRQFHATDLSRWKGRADDPRLSELVAAIRKLAGGAAPPEPLPAVSASPSRRRFIGGAAALAGLGAAGFGAWHFRRAPPASGTARIAVLPFANLSGDPAQAWFADGLAEELRSALQQIPDVQVTGRTSSEKFRDAEDPVEVARALGVSHVLTGSVRRSPSTIRISARLIDGETGVTSWSADYDRPAGDALAVQGSIATAVLGALNRRFGTAARAVTVGGTRNPEAQALFLEGSTYERPDVDEAFYLRKIAQLDAAIALDPRYAEAYRFKAIALGGVEMFKTDFEQAIKYRTAALEAAERAVAIEPNSARLLGTYAQQLMLNLKVAEGVAAADRAVAVAARNGTFSPAISRVLNAVDPGRALDLVNAYIASDPLDEFAYDVRAEANLNLRRFDAALADARKAHELSNGYRGERMIVRALLALDRPSEVRALPWIGKRSDLTFAEVEARTGNAGEADRLLGEGSGWDPRLTGYSRAVVLAQLGRTGPAVQELEGAIANRDLFLLRIAFDPALDPLRAVAGFRPLQDRVIPPNLLVAPRRL